MSEKTINPLRIVPIQQRISDVDRLGHVNNSVIAQYFDVGRLEFLTAVVPSMQFDRETLVLVHVSLDFKASARMDETLEVHSWLDRIGTKSVHMIQELYAANGELKSCCISVLSTLDVEKNTSIPMPQAWREIFTLYLPSTHE